MRYTGYARRAAPRRQSPRLVARSDGTYLITRAPGESLRAHLCRAAREAAQWYADDMARRGDPRRRADRTLLLGAVDEASYDLLVLLPVARDETPAAPVVYGVRVEVRTPITVRADVMEDSLDPAHFTARRRAARRVDRQRGEVR